MRAYFAATLFLVTAGALFVVTATNTLIFAVGLALITIGAGGFSAGLVTRGL
ncbi:hypothetical protein [Paenarthrobacter sp. YIM B13468]|uniref:hypothetical protein n=1 Tax=Paenarthrobacter sp. YIM B13468 TaxID=3366295 RepID=UPI00366F093F